MLLSLNERYNLHHLPHRVLNSQSPTNIIPRSASPSFRPLTKLVTRSVGKSSSLQIFSSQYTPYFAIEIGNQFLSRRTSRKYTPPLLSLNDFAREHVLYSSTTFISNRFVSYHHRWVLSAPWGFEQHQQHGKYRRDIGATGDHNRAQHEDFVHIGLLGPPSDDQEPLSASGFIPTLGFTA